MRTHQAIDARSLAMHRLASERLRREPGRFERVRSALDRWLREGDPNSRPYLLEWKAAVDDGLEATLRLALDESQRGAAMRQSSPVVIVLTPRERFDFLRAWREADAAR